MTLCEFVFDNYKIYLFGSCLDDCKHGGGIDLLLIVPELDYENVKSLKSVLKFDLEPSIDDQRVDLTVATEQRLQNDDFLKSIFDSMFE